MVGRFHGMQNLPAKHSRSLVWWEDSIRKTFWKTIKGPIILFGSLFEYHPISAKDQSRIHQFGKKVLPGLFLGYALYAGRIWKGDTLVSDIEELETMDASEIYSKRLNAKEVKIPTEMKNIFQPQMDESNFLEEIRNWEHPPWYGGTQFEDKVTEIFLKNQKGLFRHLTTHFRMPVKRWMTYGPCQKTSYTAITLNPESNFTRREKNHSSFHWNTLTSPELQERIWMLNKKNASMIIGILMDQETCLILGQVSLSLPYKKKNSRQMYVVRWELDKTAGNIQARSFMARTLDENGTECHAEGEATVVTWKTSAR